MYRRRGGVCYVQDDTTGKQESLRTTDKGAAREMVARNAAARQPMLNLAMAKAFLAAHEPEMLKRTWSAVFVEFATHGRDSSRDRTTRASASHAFDPIRREPIVETTAADFLDVLHRGGTATNIRSCRWLIE